MTICPCCGFKFHGSLSSGCSGCGARAVGEPLPKPSNQLPSYGRSLVLVLAGSLSVLVLVVQTIVAMVQRGFDPFGFWSWMAAAQTAAWRLKWVAIPLTIFSFWVGLRLYQSIKQNPDRFCGLRYARRGMFALTTVPTLIAILIGMTVPTRLERRAWRLEAAEVANYRRISSALLEYRLLHKKLPDDTELKKELATLPDPDGSLATALRDVDLFRYQPRAAEVAAVSTEPSSALRGAVIRRASLRSATDDMTPAGLAFTHYDMRLPGEDRILGTEDDWIDRDGVVMRLSDVAKGGIGQSASALKR